MAFLADDKEAAADPLASTMGDLILTSQLIAIQEAARAAELDPEAQCLKYMGCRTEDLNRRAGAALIEHLVRNAVVPAGGVK